MTVSEMGGKGHSDAQSAFVTTGYGCPVRRTVVPHETAPTAFLDIGVQCLDLGPWYHVLRAASADRSATPRSPRCSD